MKSRYVIALLIIFVSFVFTDANAAQKNWMDITKEIDSVLQQAKDAYKKGDVKNAKFLVDEAYFGPYEGAQMEKMVRLNISAKANSDIEAKFRKIKQAFTAKQDISQIEILISDLKKDLIKAATNLDGAKSTSFGVFLSSLLIILREGFEAILILGAIIAYLVKTGNRDKVKTIYGGVGLAIIASLITAFIIKYLFEVSGASQEVLEGSTMLLAVVVLFSMSFWLISKIEAKKWKNYIEGKVQQSLSKGSTVALWFAAFLAVFREGAETVLFYIAMYSGAEPQDANMITMGIIIGSVVLVALFAVVRYGSLKIPIKPFFIGTSLLMFYLAFVFSGQGINELQAGGVLSITSLNMPSVSFMGIYPTVETMLAQGLLLMIAIVVFGYQSKQKTI